jgi:hypothetical protein
MQNLNPSPLLEKSPTTEYQQGEPIDLVVICISVVSI